MGPDVKLVGKTGQYTDDMKLSKVVASLYCSMMVSRARALSS